MSEQQQYDFTPEELWSKFFKDRETIPWEEFRQIIKRKTYFVSLRGFKYWVSEGEPRIVNKAKWLKVLKNFNLININLSYNPPLPFSSGGNPTLMFVISNFSLPYFIPSTNEQLKNLNSGEFCFRLPSGPPNLFTLEAKNKDGKHEKNGVLLNKESKKLYITKNEMGSDLEHLIKHSDFKDYKPHEFLPLCIDKGEEELLQYFKQQCNGNESEALEQYKEAIKKGIENVEEYDPTAKKN